VLDNRRPLDQDRLQAAEKAGLTPEQLPFAAALCPTARTQLFVQAVKGIEEIEPLVLQKIDYLAFEQRRGGQMWKKELLDPVILGDCIRGLMLHYRRSMLRYKQFGSRESASNRQFLLTQSLADISFVRY